MKRFARRTTGIVAGFVAAAVTVAVTVAVAVAAVPAAAAVVPGWSAPTVLGHLQSDTASSRTAVATASNGASVVAWGALHGPTHRIAFYAATRTSSGSWSAPHLLAADDQTGAVFAGITRAGRATVLWTTGTSTTVVHEVVHRADGTWGAAHVVAGLPNVDSFSMAPDGWAAVGYAQRRTVGFPLRIAYVRRLTPQGSWQAPVRVSSRKVPAFDGSEQRSSGASDVVVGIADTGTVTATWQWVVYEDPS